MDTDEKMKVLEEENARLKEELQTTKEHLKKYTAPASRKVYYENNKEAIKERVIENGEKRQHYKSTPEQRKEYNRHIIFTKKGKHQKRIRRKTER